MSEINTTPFSNIYDSFFSKITDDMYMELNELDTYRMLNEILVNAIPHFEFPRKNIADYEEIEPIDFTTYSGVESNGDEVPATIYSGGFFNCSLTKEEINILSTYMVCGWLDQQLANIDVTRLKYSGTDFKFTSQANHLQKLLQLKKDYEREGFHLQRLYKRRAINVDGEVISTMNQIMSTPSKSMVIE